MGGRSLIQALRQGDCALHNVTRGSSRRTFASSAARQGQNVIPSFTKTSSPELDDIFTTFRQKVFLPSRLSKAQRDLIYKSKYMRMISVDPVTVNIGGEDFKLEHIDRTKDVPNFRKGFSRAISLMQDKNDWDNLPRFLIGLHQGGRQPESIPQLALVSKAAEASRLDVILECARRVQETGFSLRDPEVVKKFVAKIHDLAMSSDWSAKETKKALSWVEMVSVMLEDKKHAGGQPISSNADPRVNPELIGILLELSAVRAARHLEGKDEDGKVAEYATRLLSIPMDLEPTETSSKTPEDTYVANRWLCSVIPIIHGMKVARTVLGPASEVAKGLKTKQAELESFVPQQRKFINDNAGEKLQQKSFRGLDLYNKLLAEGSA